MDVRIVWLLVVSLSVCACSEAGSRASLDGSGTNATPAAWTITDDEIGTLRLGEPFLEPANGFEASYRTSFYGDRQPLEGFQFSDPPVYAVFKGGPFSVWGANHVGHEPPEAIKTRAIALAGAKRFKVEMLITTDARVKTPAGISVGDNYAAFARAYPTAPAPDAFIGLWEQPSCMVSRGQIWFFFDRCDDADRAKIIRIVVRREGSTV